MVGAGSPDGRQRWHAGATGADGEPGCQQWCAGAGAGTATTTTAATAAFTPSAYGAGLAHSKVYILTLYLYLEWSEKIPCLYLIHHPQSALPTLGGYPS